jgi:hypothetical protein
MNMDHSSRLLAFDQEEHETHVEKEHLNFVEVEVLESPNQGVDKKGSFAGRCLGHAVHQLAALHVHE